MAESWFIRFTRLAPILVLVPGAFAHLVFGTVPAVGVSVVSGMLIAFYVTGRETKWK